MKVIVAVFAILAASADCGVVPATTFVRTPSFDSAIVRSDRIGGSFAYSTVEGHAYAAVSPVVERVAEPVAVSVTAHQVPLGHIQTPVAVTQPIYAHHTLFNQPFIAHHQHLLTAPAAIAQIPSFGAVAAAPPVAAAPVAPAAPAPATGTVVDADTVAIESA